MFTLLLYILLVLLLTAFNNQLPSTSTSTLTMATIDSVASSTGSNHGSITISPDDSYNSNFPIDFNPERDDAICSTLEIKRHYKQTVLSPQLPELRNTAKKYARWSPRRPQQDVVINTSALAQAFPDFSQAGSPNDTFSLEAPRGRKGKQQPTVTSSALEYTSDANAKTPMINLSNNLRLMKTPMQRVEPTQPTIYEDATRNNGNVRNISSQTHAQSNTNPHNNIHTNIHSTTDTNTYNHNMRNKSNNPPPSHFATEQKENIPPMPQQQTLKKSSYTSNASRTISGERRTFKELHARVADESDGSFIGTERPATVTFQPKNTRFSKGTEKKQTQTHIFTPTGVNGKPGNATEQSFFVASALSSVANTQTNGLPTVHHGKVVNGNKPHSFDNADNFELPEDETDIYEYARKLKAQVAQLQASLESAHGTIEKIQSDGANAAALHSQAEAHQERERKQLFAENQSLKEEVRNLKNQLAHEMQSKDNATLSLEQQEFAFKNQVDRIQEEVERLHAERLENEQNYQQQQSEYQHRIDLLVSEKRTLQTQKSVLATSVEQLRQEREQDSRKWQQKEATLQKQIQQSSIAVQHLTNVTKELKESTRNIEVVTTSRTSKSPSSRSTKQKSNGSKQEQDLPSKVMKQAQNHMADIQAASGNPRSAHQETSVQQNNSSQKHQAPFQALNFDLHQQVFSQNLQQAPNNPVTQTERNNTQITQEGSFDDNTEDLQNNTQQSEGDSLSDAGTNWSSLLGHGYIPELHQHVRNLRAAKKQQLEAADQASVYEDTIQSGRSSHAPSIRSTAGNHLVRDDTIQSGRPSHAPSVRASGGILKNASIPPQEDLTGRFSIKSAKLNGRTEQDQTSRSNTHRRHRSMVEEDHTTRSNTTHRRHNSETSIHTNIRRQKEGDDMTSAYLVADIDAAKQGNGKERPVLSAAARQVLDSLCEHNHNRKNCSVCLRLASFDAKSASKTTIRVQKPVPVSKRAQSPVPYEDEPTLRPAVNPGVALATVLKALEDEVAHLKMRHSEVQKAYNEHDASLGKRERRTMKAELVSLLTKIESKSDQIYALYDVLEGQAQAGQEMTQELIDVTLTKMVNEELDNEEELPWEGIESD
ncbi:hypothetical protein L207DRAFT_517781 [Hyaloscypha variabilis F]|uniref:Cep57 centrosome microtubule-binding domain-containing protein n=1 Tax=Hyaloscypha variabilis (strain UAMH 11265 / GT02V1 / F) TaxID=1149755 RepID=A0A2J6R5D8_HYAVF|nr:hypothetical protein L207DRAFT_517781 [Hyaloscypha variabilis F]